MRPVAELRAWNALLVATNIVSPSCVRTGGTDKTFAFLSHVGSESKGSDTHPWTLADAVPKYKLWPALDSAGEVDVAQLTCCRVTI